MEKINFISKEETYRRLHHLLFGEEIGLIMATKATWNEHDISRSSHEPARIYREEEDYWVGAWLEGFGFFNVHFPKSGCREFTEEEVKKLEGCHRVLTSSL